MNILLESRVFHPSVGGVEMMSQELATAWQEYGHNVRIATRTPLDGEPELDSLNVVRRPSLARLWSLLQWSDVFVQNGISLRSLGPALLAGRPPLFIHQAVMVPGADHLGVRNALKRMATFLGYNAAISQPVADSIPGPEVHIPNTYRPTFRDTQGASDAERTGLLFVGRLVSVKGVDLALDALARLHADGKPLSLTICGGGPERPVLEQQARALGIGEHVHFEGWTAPQELATHYSQAEVALVPSRYEPFGIVALEALACGCPVVAAHTGGLPEAVGPCGLLFEPEDENDLARQIELIRQPAVREQLMNNTREHLARHDIDRIATDYLHLLHSVTQPAS